ncbi:uncharacterized protein TNCV_977661 [Trichonephila clavipes]|nr:uncharacterized protein TNCV_977661 [Trichonephila clavipes]
MYSTFVAWGTLNYHRAASRLVKRVEGEERWEAPDHPQGVLPQNWGGTDQSHTITCMVLKAKDNDRRKTLALSHDEFLCGRPAPAERPAETRHHGRGTLRTKMNQRIEKEEKIDPKPRLPKLTFRMEYI